MTGAFAGGLLRAAVLVVAGTGLGIGCNALRGDGHIDLHRRHVAEVEPPDRPGAEQRIDGIAVVDVDRAVALLADAEERPGDVVFVDVRDDESFGAGHIPGALKVDYYRAHDDLAASDRLQRISLASEVVVYCGSSECDDALLLCRELRDVYGVAPDKLLLFRGGLAAWKARGLRVAKDG